MRNSKIQLMAAVFLICGFSPTAVFAEDNAWSYHQAGDSLKSQSRPYAEYLNGYDVFAVTPNADARNMRVHVEYWEKELDVPTSLTATLTLADGRAGIAEYDISDSFKNWQGTVIVSYHLRFEDLGYFKQAVQYELDFGSKKMTIPMAGFDQAIEAALANSN